MTDIKTLAPYLAYGLRVQLQTETPRYCTVRQASFEKPWNLRLVDGGGLTWHVPIAEVKPCFRPFSHMTKEIERDGNKIVPAVEVAKLAIGARSAYAEHEIRPGKSTAAIEFSTGDTVIIYAEWNIFVGHISVGNTATYNQFAIHELLRSLHFAPPGLDESEFIAMEEE